MPISCHAFRHFAQIGENMKIILLFTLLFASVSFRGCLHEKNFDDAKEFGFIKDHVYKLNNDSYVRDWNGYVSLFADYDFNERDRSQLKKDGFLHVNKWSFYPVPQNTIVKVIGIRASRFGIGSLIFYTKFMTGKFKGKIVEITNVNWGFTIDNDDGSMSLDPKYIEDLGELSDEELIQKKLLPE